MRRLGEVSDIRLTAPLFARVQLSRHTGHYGPLLKLFGRFASIVATSATQRNERANLPQRFDRAALAA